jgi:uncharacterized protein
MPARCTADPDIGAFSLEESALSQGNNRVQTSPKNQNLNRELPMNMNGSQVIEASRDTVWKGLNDPKTLQQCIPGCDVIEVTSPTEMKATVVIKVGPVKASFAGEVTLSELKPPESYRISGKGQGGFAGFASGGATVTLTELSPTQTQMDYTVDAQIGGKLAMLGSRLIDSTAQSLAGQFFTKFGSLMKSQAATTTPPKEKVADKKSAATKTAVKKATAKKASAKKPVVKKALSKKAAAKKAPVKKPAKKR